MCWPNNSKGTISVEFCLSPLALNMLPGVVWALPTLFFCPWIGVFAPWVQLSEKTGAIVLMVSSSANGATDGLMERQNFRSPFYKLCSNLTSSAVHVVCNSPIRVVKTRAAWRRRHSDPIVSRLEKRISRWTHLPVNHQEALQVNANQRAHPADVQTEGFVEHPTPRWRTRAFLPSSAMATKNSLCKENVMPFVLGFTLWNRWRPASFACVTILSGQVGPQCCYKLCKSQLKAHTGGAANTRNAHNLLPT